MIDTKHIRRDFYSVAWVRPGVLRGQKLNTPCPDVMVSPPKPMDQIQPNLVCELLT